MNILVMNDMRCGSNYGLATEDKINNPYHKWVYSKYLEIVNFSQNVGIDYLVGVGDIVDGYKGKDSTTHWTTDVNKQVECAIELLIPLMNKNTKVCGSSDFGENKIVIENLGGKFYKNNFKLKTSQGDIMFNTCKNKNVDHRKIIVGSSNIKLLMTNITPRYDSFEIGSVKIVNAPCWSYPIDYALTLHIDIGCLIIKINKHNINTELMSNLFWPSCLN